MDIPPINTDYRDAWLKQLKEQVDQNSSDIFNIDVSLGGLGSRLDDVESVVIDVPSPKKNEGILVPCGGTHRTEANPYGLRGNMHLGYDATKSFIINHFNRAKALGVKRMILHMFQGWNSVMKMPGSLLMKEQLGVRWDALRDALSECRSVDPDFIFGIYFNFSIPTVNGIETYGTLEYDGIVPYNHDNPLHYDIIINKIIRPLSELGIKEYWADNSSPDEFKETSIKLFNTIDKIFKIKCVFEAIPNYKVGSTFYHDSRYLDQFSSSALYRFISGRNMASMMIPSSQEVIVILTNHDNLLINQEIVSQLRLNGYTIFSGIEAYDNLLIP